MLIQIKKGRKRSYKKVRIIKNRHLLITSTINFHSLTVTIKSKVKDEDDEDDKGEWKTVTTGTASSSEKPKMFAKDAEIDIPAVISKLNEVIFSMMSF